MHRPTIGIIAIVLLVTSVVMAIVQPENEAIMSGALRVGAVMAALWLAHPQLSRLPSWLTLGVVAVVLVTALRPKLFLAAIVVLVAVAILRPRRPARRQSQGP